MFSKHLDAVSMYRLLFAVDATRYYYGVPWGARLLLLLLYATTVYSTAYRVILEMAWHCGRLSEHVLPLKGKQSVPSGKRNQTRNLR